MLFLGIAFTWRRAFHRDARSVRYAPSSPDDNRRTWPSVLHHRPSCL